MQLHPMSDDIELRFRHTSGDVGPLKCAGTMSVGAVKERLLSEWPKEGPMHADQPSSTADIKLILGGKFLDNGEILNDLRPAMGEIKADTVVTMHVIVRLAGAGKAQGPSSKEKERQQGCYCLIQ
ncbi:probable membrane-anchored ubiquitin-fold protein 4 [Coccomyxa sp. Obi]|nr:probable membrane-anchored ubiquitin-fold protein 4 [Coccomyxa sp. Obi]